MSINRKLFIGSEWLYFNIYTSPIHTDNILINIFSPLINHLLSKKIIHSFFFIRYNDPYFHIRLRFKITSNQAILLIINEVHKKLNACIKKEHVWKITIDTYDREFNRYGKFNIFDTESLFFYDSLNVLKLLKIIYENKIQEDIKLLLSIKYIMNLIDAFLDNIIEKITLISFMSESLKKEFNLNKKSKKLINAYYAELRKLELDDIKIYSNSLYLTTNKNLVIKIKKQLIKDSISLNDYIFSLIHMFCNRYFNDDNRKMELIVYDFVLKEYNKKKFLKIE